MRACQNCWYHNFKDVNLAALKSTVFKGETLSKKGGQATGFQGGNAFAQKLTLPQLNFGTTSWRVGEVAGPATRNSAKCCVKVLRQGVGAGSSNAGIVNWGINALKNI